MSQSYIPQTQVQEQEEQEKRRQVVSYQTVLEEIKKKYLEATKKEKKLTAVRKALEEMGFKDIKRIWFSTDEDAKAFAPIPANEIDEQVLEAVEWLVGKDWKITGFEVEATTYQIDLSGEDEKWGKVNLPYKYGFIESFVPGEGSFYIELGKKNVEGIDVYLYLVINVERRR